MQMIDMEAKVEKTKTTVPRLGAIMAGHKSCGMEAVSYTHLDVYKRQVKIMLFQLQHIH